MIGDDGITNNRLNNASVDDIDDNESFATSDALASVLQKSEPGFADNLTSAAPEDVFDFESEFGLIELDQVL